MNGLTLVHTVQSSGLFIHMYVIYIRFLTTRQEIGWEEHLRYDLFSVEWDVKP